jgi:hypothetical protein
LFASGDSQTRATLRAPCERALRLDPAPVLWANWYATVYHGLPTSLYTCGRGDGGYLGFIGRVCPEKRPDWAIEIARRARRPLAIAAKVDRVDRT